MKSFQKPANNLQELHLPHPGIIDPKGFNDRFELHCYKPSSDLQPFVTHIWTQRHRHPSVQSKLQTEILSGPSMHLFFTTETVFIHNITRRFKYSPHTSPVIAGVKFRPGGLYPFLQRPIPKLTTHIPATLFFPAANHRFRNELLCQSDEIIVSMLEALLRSSQPKEDKKLERITKILDTLDSNPTLQTVASVAQTFHMSERSLQLLFQNHVGIGLKWIITRRRLLAAIEHIHEQPHSSWIKIAARLGYSSQSHFTREFKETIGQLPSQYLKGLRYDK